MRPASRREETEIVPTTQLELQKAAIAASAQITASMVTVTSEKNPAKISEAYRVIYKTIMDTVKGSAQKK